MACNYKLKQPHHLYITRIIVGYLFMFGLMKQDLNQGAIDLFELNEENIPNTIIADNTGGILMQRGKLIFA